VAVTRRQVLAVTAASSAAAIAGVGAHVWTWYDRAPGEALAVLSPEEHGFVQALADAWMPPGGVPAISGSEARMGDFLDGVIASMATTQGKLFRLLCSLRHYIFKVNNFLTCIHPKFLHFSFPLIQTHHLLQRHAHVKNQLHDY
jgi:hypothetical protein